MGNALVAGPGSTALLTSSLACIAVNLVRERESFSVTFRALSDHTLSTSTPLQTHGPAAGAARWRQ